MTRYKACKDSTGVVSAQNEYLQMIQDEKNSHREHNRLMAAAASGMCYVFIVYLCVCLFWCVGVCHVLVLIVFFDVFCDVVG